MALRSQDLRAIARDVGIRLALFVLTFALAFAIGFFALWR